MATITLLAIVLVALSVTALAVFVGFFSRSKSSAKDPALLAELSELREENARLREEIEQLRKRPDTGSTGIKEG